MASGKVSRPIYVCFRCGDNRIGDSNINGEFVCYRCGLVCYYQLEFAIPLGATAFFKTYQRIFYFNERIKRWRCEEPSIPKDILYYIKYEASKPQYGGRDSINRRTIGQILKSVNLPKCVRKQYQSKKFKQTLLTKKRFYDKYFEKWKTICCYLTGDETNIPDHAYTEYIRTLFISCQQPFELFKHKENCDGRHNCYRTFGCWHNFINYDFIFRKLMQIAEIKYPQFAGNFEKFKDEFPLVSKKIRDSKLKPIWKSIVDYLDWPNVEDD